ncbi:PhzF family phenazine biosynthesis protein [Georgenia wangjunii]|uniref:PhzF family phenazine biosynthesis protein n=1 Tax=Georgenia wangjunii TaxID=3117730 RepID=UPI002F26AB22
MAEHRFSQVDVFSSEPFRGNPVAVVHDADGVDSATMAAFARWTNLSETTFLLAPQEAGADYRLRIFTPGGELPFAGHPTLGSARAWLEAGGAPRGAGAVVQECGIGLVRVRVDGGALAFAAPALLRSGPLDAALRERVARALGLEAGAVVDAAWVDNGPGWIGVLLPDAETVLGLRPDLAALGELPVGVMGPHAPGGPADYEVRAFVPGIGVPEDPVTGSVNAGLARWLIGAGLAPSSYTVAQGTALGRSGRVGIRSVDGEIWVGGQARTLVTGAVDI